MNSSYSYNHYYSQSQSQDQYPPLILKQEDHHHHDHTPGICATKNKKKKTAAAESSTGKGSGGGGVKLSTDPQSVAARERRHRISRRLKTLQSLVPGAAKLDTVSVLDHAIHYIHFLRSQIRFHHLLLSFSPTSAMDLPPPPCFGGEVVEMVSPPPPYHGGVWGKEGCFGSPVQGEDVCSGESTAITPYF